MILWLFVTNRGTATVRLQRKLTTEGRDTAQSNFRWLIENWLKLPEQ